MLSLALKKGLIKMKSGFKSILTYQMINGVFFNRPGPIDELLRFSAQCMRKI